jgi:predicted SnoaL-like aldol condensation-catalyzing enzyme
MKVSRVWRVLALFAVALSVLAWGVTSAMSGSRSHPRSAAPTASAKANKAACGPLCQEQQRLERNKSNVVHFYTLAFNDGNPRLAVELYGGAEYIQHNPLAANGFDAFIAFFESFKAAFPDARIDIKRVIAEGDFVVTHSLITGATAIFGPRGSKVVDIFRLDDHGKIVEHWDVLAQISATSANGNPEV